MAVVILVGAWVLGNFARKLIEVYLQPYAQSTETDFDERILYLLDLTLAYVIYALGIMAALHTVGVEITGLVASLGILGLAAALAAKTVLSNFFGGMILTVDRYIQPGHRVKIGDWIGDVEEITLYKTTLRTRDNLLVSIPNDVLMNQTTVNYNLPESLTRIELTIGVDYGADLDGATEILLDIASGLDTVSDRKSPEVNVVSLADSVVELEMLVWQNQPTGARHTRDAIYRAALERFEDAGIEIPYPHRDVTVRSGSSEDTE
jgi:MscS family membrane protein